MFGKIKLFVTLIAMSAILAVSAIAQDAQTRTLTAGQKYKIKGTVVATDNGSFVVRDITGVDTKINIASNTSVKSNSFWGGGNSYPQTAIVRGLMLEVEGRGDTSGALAANKVRFDKSDLEVAQSIDSRVAPAEERITAAEQNAERISGQIDELMAISNAARGGAKAAQDTADAAIAGVNATNQRISSLDDYVVQSTSMVNFKVGSAVLSPDAKQKLDEVATAAMTMRGYYIEITGFASADGGERANKLLSERRAKAVIDYMIQTHNVPLRRIGQSYGYGELQAVADNTTREGRAENRRVEVKLMVSRGINQNVEVRTANPDDTTTDTTTTAQPPSTDEQ